MNLTPPIIGPVSVCEFTENVKYEVFNTNGSSYNWSVNGGLLVSGQDNSEIRVDWLGEGLAQVSTTQYAFDSVNNKACFGDTQTLNVNLRPNPESDTILGDSAFCLGEQIEFSSNGFPNSTYYWSINNTTRDTFGPGNNTFSRIADSIGSFSVGVKEITEYGCEGDILRKEYSVHPVPQTQGIFGQDTACLAGLSQLEYSVIGNADSEYEWLVEGGSIIGDDSLQSVTIDWQTYPAGTIQAVERSLFGCGGDTLEKRVIIDATELSMNYVSTQFENEETIEIDWDVLNPAYLKNPLLLYRRLGGEDPNNLIESIEPNIARYEDLKLKTLELSYAYLVTTEDLCGNQIQSDIHESILLVGSKNDEYSVSLNWNSYDGWQNGVESYEILRKRNDQPNYENFMVTQETAVNIDVGLDGYDQCYRVKALEEGGNNESYSNSVCFSFRGIIYIPNAFSPNGDGINDFFKVVGSNFKSFKMQIFSRWGELLFESTDINEAWDGTYNGNKVSVDTYLLMITYDDTKRINSYRGTLNVVD